MAPLVPLLRERSGGNPFFLEELVQALAESGAVSGTKGAYALTVPVETLDVPLSVHTVLAARVDRLPESVMRGAPFTGRWRRR